MLSAHIPNLSWAVRLQTSRLQVPSNWMNLNNMVSSVEARQVEA